MGRRHRTWPPGWRILTGTLTHGASMYCSFPRKLCLPFSRVPPETFTAQIVSFFSPTGRTKGTARAFVGGMTDAVSDSALLGLAIAQGNVEGVRAILDAALGAGLDATRRLLQDKFRQDPLIFALIRHAPRALQVTDKRVQVRAAGWLLSE